VQLIYISPFHSKIHTSQCNRQQTNTVYKSTSNCDEILAVSCTFQQYVSTFSNSRTNKRRPKWWHITSLSVTKMVWHM